MKKILILVFALVSFLTTNHAQNNSDFEDLRSAYLNIQQGNYKAAIGYVEKMHRLYPKDPTYNYYLGRCLLFLDKNPGNAIKYLRYAATKDVENEVYFYLGIAYLKNYRFDKAIENFMWFEKGANKKRLNELDFQNYLSMAQNGQYLTKYIRKPLVYEQIETDKTGFYKYYNVDGLQRHFGFTRDYLKLEQDSLKEPAIIYIPGQAGKNEVLYFAAVNKKRGDYDIFRMARLSDSTWSEAENLGDAINTPFDENFPFLHSDGQTLYFASKGHYSMGGYDLYKSTWNWDSQEWSEPENLDFPVNSPYNDVLFVPTPNKRTACFASDRSSKDDQIIIYKMKLNSSAPYIELNNHEDILAYAQLKVNYSQDEKENDKKASKYETQQKELVKIKSDESLIYKSQYDSLLNLAVAFQLKADSLRWIIDDSRSLFDKTENGRERAVLSNKIVEMEREVYSLQKKADHCYEQVREIEQTNLASKKTIYEDTGEEKTHSKEIKDEEQQKNSNLFVEPVIDSLSRSKLSAVETEVVDSSGLFQYGLVEKIPSSYNTENPVPLNENLPDGIVYMIQLGAFSSEKSAEVFKGLEPLSCIKKEDSKIRKYYAGKFLQLLEAEKGLPLVKSKGFKDAYIVAFNKNQIVPVNSAVKMESKEIPKTVYKPKVSKTETEKEEKDLAVVFVLKGSIEIKDSLLISNMNAELSDGIDLYIDQKEKQINYTIKSFKRYDDALPVKTKLEKILKKEIEIHAYFAENQIPLEQARKITK